MDIATIFGLLLATAAIVYSVLAGGGTFGAFVDYPSIACVGGGAVAVVFICFPLKTVLSIIKVTKIVFLNKPPNLPELIETIVGLAEVARRDGLLALESKIAEIKNPFIVLGIQMAVDGTQPEVIEDILRTEIDAIAMRHRDGKAVMDQAGRFAPAFGMIGTLLGLVMMLGNMDDPAAIGPGMAVALLTTLYGAMISNMFTIPFSEKLNFLNKQELHALEVSLKGIMGIQSGDNPRVIEQKLNSFLHPKQRKGSNQAA
ncbi:MAG: motility protein A [Planctomycetes bacterium]|nr:motility protein A [Planctomycetota bacterium]